MFEDIGRGRFYLGDCLEIMKEIPDGVIDMVMCDLPYGTTQNKWDSVLALDQLWEQYWRLSAGVVALTSTQPFTGVLVTSELDSFRYEWIWKKSRVTGFLNAKRQPLRQHESVSIFSQKVPPYFPQDTIATKKTCRGQSVSTDNYGKHGGVVYEQTTTNWPRSVLEIKSESKGFHPTQKPVALFEYLIKTYTNEGDLVLDNCAGSGTTAIACENTGRRWVCIEKDETYYAKAVERVKGHIND